MKKSKIWSPLGLEVEDASKGDREAKDTCVLKLDMNIRCNHTHHVLKMEFEISITVYNYSFENNSPETLQQSQLRVPHKAIDPNHKTKLVLIEEC